MVEQNQLVSLAQAREDINQQRQEIEQRNLEAARTKELIQKQLQDISTQSKLRNLDLQGKNIFNTNVNRLNQSRSDLITYQGELKKAGEDITSYETNVLNPAEQQQKTYEEQFKQYEQQQQGYDDALNWFYGTGRQNYGYNQLSNPYAREVAKELLLNEGVNEEIAAYNKNVEKPVLTVSSLVYQDFLKNNLIPAGRRVEVINVNPTTIEKGQTYNAELNGKNYYLSSGAAQDLMSGKLDINFRDTKIQQPQPNAMYNNDLTGLKTSDLSSVYSQNSLLTTAERQSIKNNNFIPNLFAGLFNNKVTQKFLEFNKPNMDATQRAEQRLKEQRKNLSSDTFTWTGGLLKFSSSVSDVLLSPTYTSTNKFTGEKSEFKPFESLNKNVSPKVANKLINTLDILIKANIFAPFFEKAAYNKKAKTKQEVVYKRKFTDEKTKEAVEKIKYKLEKTFIEKDKDAVTKDVIDMWKSLKDQEAKDAFEEHILKDLVDKKILDGYLIVDGKLIIKEPLGSWDLSSNIFDKLGTPTGENLYSNLKTEGKISSLGDLGKIKTGVLDTTTNRIDFSSLAAPADLKYNPELITLAGLISTPQDKEERKKDETNKNILIISTPQSNPTITSSTIIGASIFKTPSTPNIKTNNALKNPSLNIQIPILKSPQVNQQLQKQVQQQLQKQIQKQVQQQAQPQRMNLKTSMTFKGKFDFGLPQSSKITGTSKVSKLKKAFDVLVKRKGKYFTIGKGLTENKAKKVGSIYAMRTLARTFKLKESGTTSDTDIKYNLPSGVFRMPKNREPLTFVQIQALNRGSGEIPEILSFKRKKSKRFKII